MTRRRELKEYLLNKRKGMILKVRLQKLMEDGFNPNIIRRALSNGELKKTRVIIPNKNGGYPKIESYIGLNPKRVQAIENYIKENTNKDE